ncbi:MAG: hypothetical protein A3F10_01495 [Coxiella sp. RIFCSPHIGHO2_12_FULL_42_15]|nr:MAG: hypothetical protein A3F10_01495 [Coxiella sp. RIFCSPHIGHO2_12_FULL_42_15]
MYYAIYCIDHNDSREKRRSVRQAHLQRLLELEKEDRLLIAGPLLQKDHDENMTFGATGSLIVAEFNDLETAKVWAAADPYVTADVYERVTILPFKKILPNE